MRRFGRWGPMWKKSIEVIALAEYMRYGQSPKKKKAGGFFAPLVFVVVLIMLVFCVGLFFRVQTIEVVGAQTYTADEIIEASGVEQGDNLFFIDRFGGASNIFSRLPFVDSAVIEREMPSTVIITVQEAKAAACLSWQGQSWMMTASGKLLGSADAVQASQLIAVSGFEPVSPTVGETAQAAEGDELKLAYLKDILTALDQNGMLDQVQSIDLSVAVNPSMEYLGGRFTVKLGEDEQLDYKLRMLLATVRQLGADETGIIDVSDGSTVYVSPD